MATGRTTLSVSLPMETAQAINDMATHSQVTVSGLIRHILELAIADRTGGLVGPIIDTSDDRRLGGGCCG